MGKDKALRLADAANFNVKHGNIKTGIGMFAAAVAESAEEDEETETEGEPLMTSIPDFLPTLAAGAHSKGDGQACVMEYVSILAGENFSDHPSCTDPILAAAARSVNDWMSDEGRSALVPLIGRLFGTAARGNDEVGIKLAEFVNGYVHAAMETESVQSTDERLSEYLTAIIDKFDALTNFSYEADGRQLSESEFKVLADAVTSRQ